MRLFDKMSSVPALQFIKVYIQFAWMFDQEILPDSTFDMSCTEILTSLQFDCLESFSLHVSFINQNIFLQILILCTLFLLFYLHM